MMSEDSGSDDNINNNIVNLLYIQKIFARCPTCEKYLCFFEFYNLNCNKCGKINFQKIKLVNNFYLQ